MPDCDLRPGNDSTDIATAMASNVRNGLYWERFKPSALSGLVPLRYREDRRIVASVRPSHESPETLPTGLLND